VDQGVGHEPGAVGGRSVPGGQPHADLLLAASVGEPDIELAGPVVRPDAVGHPAESAQLAALLFQELPQNPSGLPVGRLPGLVSGCPLDLGPVLAGVEYKIGKRQRDAGLACVAGPSYTPVKSRLPD
jgi:hypothetical protein